MNDMELDDLKTSWRDLDERLARTDARIDRLAASVAARKVSSSLDWLRRRTTLFLLLVGMLPLGFVQLFRQFDEGPTTAVSVCMGLFVCAMLFRQVLLLVLLQRIRPELQSVRALCRAVLHWRRCFLWGVVVGVVLVIPLFVSLFAFFAGQPQDDYLLWGFFAGLALGAAVGVRVFLKMLREIDALRDALATDDE